MQQHASPIPLPVLLVALLAAWALAAWRLPQLEPAWLLALAASAWLLLGRHRQAWEQGQTNPGVHLFAAALPLLLAWGLYRHTLNGWWMYDDTYVLWRVAEHGISGHFFNPAIWKDFSNVTFAPWSLLSNGVDLYAFGVNAEAHFLHHLLAFFLLLALAYVLFCRFLPPLFASLSLSLFLVSTPAAALVSFLMLRHYLEGLVLAVLAVLAYLAALQRQRVWLAWLGALAYLAASSAKEIYVPLVAALLLLPPWTEDWRSLLRERWRYWLPFVLAAALYVGWRFFMLGGNILSSYGESYAPSGWLDLLGYPQRLFSLLNWPVWLLFPVVLALGGLAFWWYRRPARHGFLLLAWVGLLWLPVISVIPILMTRHILLQALFLSFSLALGLTVWAQHSSRLRLAALFLGVLLLGGSLEGLSRYADWTDRETPARYRAEGEFLLHKQGQEGVLLEPTGVPQHLWGLFGLRRDFLGQPYGPQGLFDPCVSSTVPQRAYRWDGTALAAATPPPTECRKRADAPLSLTIELDNTVFRWRMGPYQEGIYTILVLDKDEDFIVAFPSVPHTVVFNYIPLAPLRFVLRYNAPQGWHSYSPPLVFDPAPLAKTGQAELHYRRD